MEKIEITPKTEEQIQEKIKFDRWIAAMKKDEKALRNFVLIYLFICIVAAVIHLFSGKSAPLFVF